MVLLWKVKGVDTHKRQVSILIKGNPRRRSQFSFILQTSSATADK